LPHWNWSEGVEIKVAAYTNGDEVELFLNDESLGRKRVDPIDMVEWTVPYRAGAIKALAFRRGQLIANTSIETTGAPSALGLEIHPSFDSRSVPANGAFAIPVTVFATDAQSRRVPTASGLVSFEL